MTIVTERLLDQAQQYWDQQRPVPLDLFARMAQEGIDVETLEAQALDI